MKLNGGGGGRGKYLAARCICLQLRDQSPEVACNWHSSQSTSYHHQILNLLDTSNYRIIVISWKLKKIPVVEVLSQSTPSAFQGPYREVKSKQS